MFVLTYNEGAVAQKALWLKLVTKVYLDEIRSRLT